MNLPLIHFGPQLRCPSDPMFASLVANSLASNDAFIAKLSSALAKELLMSSTVQEAVANLQTVAQRAVSEVQSLQAQHTNDQATIAAKDQAIADLNAKLEAAQAGDPAAVSAIDAVTASLDQVAPAPAPAPEPAPAEAQPQG